MKTIVKELKLESRIEVCSKSEASLTIKNHKPNFHNKPTFRLIDANKMSIGKVAKEILEKINNEIRSKTKLAQWQSTVDVINWFKQSYNVRQKLSFVQFNIVTFHPDITR